MSLLRKKDIEDQVRGGEAFYTKAEHFLRIDGVWSINKSYETGMDVKQNIDFLTKFNQSL